MLARAAERFGYRPRRVVADTAYGSAPFLAFVRDQGAIPHIPVLERSGQTKGKLTRAAFTYDRDRDRYTCPASKVLTHAGLERRTGVHVYIARPAACQACPLRAQCTDGRYRRVTRLEDEDARDLARAEMRTSMFKRSMRLRRGVERLFADAKARRGLVRLHLRGIRGAEEEFELAAAVSNLVLLARPAERAPRSGRARASTYRLAVMGRINQGGLEPACPPVVSL